MRAPVEGSAEVAALREPLPVAAGRSSTIAPQIISAHTKSMTTIATAQVRLRHPRAFFARWADMATWPEWNTDTEWVRLDGHSRGRDRRAQAQGRPEGPFVVERLVPGREFVDVSLLLGARLTFGTTSRARRRRQRRRRHDLHDRAARRAVAAGPGQGIRRRPARPGRARRRRRVADTPRDAAARGRLATGTPSADESPGLLLWQVTNRWQAAQRAALKPFELTHVQFVLLASLTWLRRTARSPSASSPTTRRPTR